MLGEIHFGLALLHVGTVDLLHVVVIENRGTGRDRRQKRFQLLEQAIVEYARVRCSFKHVVFEDVPPGEDQVVQSGQGDEFFNFRRSAIGAFAEADGSHLRERADRLGNAFADGFDTGHECGGHGTHARDHDSKLSFGRLDGAIIRHLSRRFSGAGAGRQLHFAAGPFGVGQGRLTVFMFACCGRIGKLLAMTAAVRIPPVGHEDSRSFLIHDSLSWWRWLVTATVNKTGNGLTPHDPPASSDIQLREMPSQWSEGAATGRLLGPHTADHRNYTERLQFPF